MTPKPKLVFMDHKYRQRTKSTVFLDALFSEKYIVKRIFDDSYLGYPRPSIEMINCENPKAIVYFGAIDETETLKKINCKNIIWMPMYDSEINRSIIGWLRYRRVKIKVICFSKKLYLKLRILGFDTIYSQYYLKPDFNLRKNRKSRTKELTIFFWNRTKRINWNTVKVLLNKDYVGKVIFLNFPDPYHPAVLPSTEDVKEFNIEIINHWLSKEKYLKIMSRADVFISPRLYEGIGLGFVEAISKGLCIVAPNKPTMNEYITDHFNGYLFDPLNPQNLDLGDFKSVLRNSMASAKIGYKQWEESKTAVLDFISRE